MLSIPNLPHETTPVGKDEHDNRIVGSWGETPHFEFEPLAHWELGARLGLVDFERASKISGARLYVLRGRGARLERAMSNFRLDLIPGGEG